MLQMHAKTFHDYETGVAVYEIACQNSHFFHTRSNKFEISSTVTAYVYVRRIQLVSKRSTIMPFCLA